MYLQHLVLVKPLLLPAVIVEELERVSGGISTHHQERTQLHIQHLALVKPLLLPAAMLSWESSNSSNSSTIMAGSSNGLTSTRCCR